MTLGQGVYIKEGSQHGAAASSNASGNAAASVAVAAAAVWRPPQAPFLDMELQRL